MARNNGDDAEEEDENNHDVEMADRGHDQEPPLAAVAVARAPEDNQEPSLLEQLMDRIRTFLGVAPEDAIDEDQARRLLEASAGDLDTVTNLYLDHYFASLGDRRNVRRPADEESPRRVRRRLEEELEEHVAENANENMQEEEEEANEDEQDPPADDDEDDDPDDEMPPPALPANRRRAVNRLAARVQDDDGDNNGEGAAVSDDEGPRDGPSRRSRRRVRIQRQAANDAGEAPLLRNISIEAGSELEQQLNEVMQAPIQQNQVSVKKEEEEGYEEDLGDDFLSDHDWIFQDGSSTSSTMPPELLLWGELSGQSESSPRNDNDDGSTDNAPPIAEGHNVVAEDDDDEDGDDTAPAETPKEGIPKTWIRAGFTASSCGTGLVTQPPDDDDSTLFRLRQSQNSGSRNIAPPPYHCRGVTALLSVATALMYSGASIQGSTVDCNAARAPFSELSEEDRKREFDSRLVDALSSLLLIAAKASLQRKKRALAKRRLVSPPGSGDDDKRRQQIIDRKLRLIPTCRFADDNGTGDGSLVEGQQAQIATSYTSVEDIRSYVVSTMRSFTKKGGCALFLETIIRIHGKACIDTMLRSSRRKASLPAKEFLIECECEKRQKKLSQMPYGASTRPIEEALPLDHTCISTELISLLLTGEVHSNFQGWSTGSLGVGLLTMEPGEVGRQLMRPQQPVWLLRGDTCYSVAWLDGNKEHTESVLRGEAGTLHHWNGWFGDRHKSSMRLITARGKWSPPVFSKVRAAGSDRKTVSQQIMARRREQSHIVSSDEQGEDESAEQIVTKEEIEQVKVHPDDERLYPNEFRSWRFDMGHPAPEKVKAEEDVKIGQCGKELLHWVPYFRLDDRQQMIVEMKVSPKIKRILWTRWPGATIDRFNPEDDDTPPVV